MTEHLWLGQDQEEEPKAGEILVKEPAVIESVNNRIYFYSEISRESVLKLNRELYEKGSNLLARSIYEGTEVTSIQLHINSYGGSIFAGLACLDEIINCPVPVNTVIDGCCASAGTFLSVVGKRRFIKRHAFMLVHQLQSVMWGKYQEFEDEMENLKRLMKMIKDIYKEYTNLPMKNLDEILKHDLWFDAETCLKYGLVDEILEK